MSKKMKVFVSIVIIVVMVIGIVKCYAIIHDDPDKRTYVTITDENRDNLNVTKTNVFTQYECGLLVNWSIEINGHLYQVILPDGTDGLWSKEAIAEFIFNSRETTYFE